MQDHPDIDLKPSKFRIAIWAIIMAAVLIGGGIMLWRAYQLKQSAIIEKGGMPPVSQGEPASEDTTSPSLKGETGGEAGNGEANDEFVARADTSVHFPSPPSDLNETDPWLREQLPLVDPHPTFLQWLGQTSDLLRKTVLLADQVSKGKVPRKAFSFWVPEEDFKAKETSNGKYALDPANYHRYDLLAEVIDAIDMDLAWRVYQLVRPLAQEAYAEFAPPGKQFDQVLLTAAEHLLSTPQPRGVIALVKPSVMYKYADSRLEALSPAQKLLLRMGPVNATVIKHKLGLLRGYLLKETSRANHPPSLPLP